MQLESKNFNRMGLVAALEGPFCAHKSFCFLLFRIQVRRVSLSPFLSITCAPLAKKREAVAKSVRGHEPAELLVRVQLPAFSTDFR